MIEGPSGIRAHRAATTGRASRRRGGGWSGGTARWRRCFRRRIPRACAGRNSTPPGATSWRSGSMPRRASTCCSSGCGWATRPRQMVTTTPRPTPLLKRLLADPAVAVTRMRDGGQCGEPGAGLPRRACERRYGGTRLGAAGTRRRTDRGPRGRAVDARHDRGGARSTRRRSCGRIVVAVDPPASARRTSDACGIVAAGLDGGRARRWCWPTRRCGAARAAGLGRRGGGALPPAARPTAWWPRSTRAATW